MTSYKLYRGASASLDDIYIYTVETWGIDQADRYIDGFFACFESIANEIVVWRPIPSELEVQGFYCRYERHYIYWKRLSDGTIGIAAILHDRMHQIAQLRDAFNDIENDSSA